METDRKLEAGIAVDISSSFLIDLTAPYANSIYPNAFQAPLLIKFDWRPDLEL